MDPRTNINDDRNSSDSDQVYLECHNEIPVEDSGLAPQSNDYAEEPWWYPQSSNDYES